MRIESIESLIDWTQRVHAHLAKALAQALNTQQKERERELLDYLQHHETRLETMVAAFEEQADIKALHTMVYDYDAHTPVEIARIGDKAYDSMDYDTLANDVLDTHNQVINLYRYLITQSVIPEESELLQALLDMEEHETRQMSQQINRGRDI